MARANIVTEKSGKVGGAKNSKSGSSHHRCSIKKLFLKISQYSQENTCFRASFLKLIKKRVQHRYFYVNIGCFLKLKRILKDCFARMRWLVSTFERNSRQWYKQTEFTVIDETPRNFYASYNCAFKVYLQDKQGILFRRMTDTSDRYVTRIIPYTTPVANTSKVNNSQKQSF